MQHMTLTDALICMMAKQELALYGWPADLHPVYRFQEGLADEVMFTGMLSTVDLVRLVPVLRARRYLSRTEARTLMAAVSDHGVTVRMRGDARHDLEGLELSGLPDAMEMTGRRLLRALAEQYACLCQSVRTLGRLLTNGTHPAEYQEVLFSRATLNTQLQAVAVDPAACGVCETDEGLLSEYIRLILEENARVASVCFRVMCGGLLMAESWAAEVVMMPGQPTRKWVSLDEVRYVAGEARAAIAERVTAFHSFLHA